MDTRSLFRSARKNMLGCISDFNIGIGIFAAAGTAITAASFAGAFGVVSVARPFLEHCADRSILPLVGGFSGVTITLALTRPVLGGAEWLTDQLGIK